MSKVMEATRMSALWRRMAGEYAATGGIWGIPEAAWRRALELAASSPGCEVMGRRVSLPVGPAAGPHTQATPNIIAAWLAGGRVFELKTVQAMDRLDIAKPCIDALDDCHNTEWSTEFSLDEARGEYLRAWIAIQVLEELLTGGDSPLPGRQLDCLFKLSVGYTLEGIQSPAVDGFIEGMVRPAGSAAWGAALAETAAALDGEACRLAFGAAACGRGLARLSRLDDAPVHSVTLSTMHGCPPDEIDRIARHLMENKRLDTWVKLNPTLLGHASAQRILDSLGWRSLELDPAGFAHDLQFPQALELIAALRAAARAAGVDFGLKLSNTLANRNPGSFLPGPERYLSGRALHPLTTELAARLARALPEPLPFSFCGGVDAANAAACLRAGLYPLTLASDLLKPGGYLRLQDIAARVVPALGEAPALPDADALEDLAAAALSRPQSRADWKRGRAGIDRPLPVFDCFAAPCVAACPVHQRVPDYLREAGAGDWEAARATILADNPLPRITGVLCDHVCQDHCSRIDYEGSVAIRDLKLTCSRHAGQAEDAADRPLGRQPIAHDGREAQAAPVAIVGAGPAGLACAWWLARAGARPVVFDRAPQAAGAVANVIPPFRIARADIDSDLERLRAAGVEFRLGQAVNGPADLAGPAGAAFAAVFLAGGAPVPRRLTLSGAGVRRLDALEFLRLAGHDRRAFPGVRRILVAGGGNTAMDACRAALTQADAATVHLSYRRGRADMPADREELEHCLEEGTVLLGPSQPEALEPGRVVLRRMAAGAPDQSGRPRPLPTGETFALDCDLLVEAIGEAPDQAWLAGFGVACGTDGRPLVDPASLESRTPGVWVGGDARRGPASIIAAAADGRRAARSIAARLGLDFPAPGLPGAPGPAAGGDPAIPRPAPDRLAERGALRPSLSRLDPGYAANEVGRCLECDRACLRCVEVCPNRANIAIPVRPEDGFAQAWQIVHLDRFCNECGNCGRFCPSSGDPCRDKPALFASPAAMAASASPGLCFTAETGDPAAPTLRVRTARSGPVTGMPAPAIGMEREPSCPEPAVPDRSGASRAALDSPGPAAPGGRASPELEPFVSLARVIRRDHPYLLAGGEK